MSKRSKDRVKQLPSTGPMRQNFKSLLAFVRRTASLGVDYLCQRFNWSATIQTLALILTAIFTGLLWYVTSEYTQFTRQIFQSQHEQYIYEALSGSAFEVSVLHDPSVRGLVNKRLRVRLRNLTNLDFDGVRVEVFAKIRDRQSDQIIDVFLFEPFVSKPLTAQGLIELEDMQSDAAYHLDEGGFMTKDHLLDSRFEISKFFAHVEGLSPGGVLWRTTEPRH